MDLERIPNLTIETSVEGINQPYTLRGNFIGILTNHDNEGNHSVAAEIMKRLAPSPLSRKEMLERIEFDPEYSELFVYGTFRDLMYVAKAIESIYLDIDNHNAMQHDDCKACGTWWGNEDYDNVEG
jgi:hypothetical protein